MGLEGREETGTKSPRSPRPRRTGSGDERRGRDPGPHGGFWGVFERRVLATPDQNPPPSACLKGSPELHGMQE